MRSQESQFILIFIPERACLAFNCGGIPHRRTGFEMKTWILAAAIVFAAGGPIWIDRDIANAATLETNKITEVNIANIKSLLKLTAEQEPLWARVESVLHDVAREQTDESTGLVRRISRRIVSIAFNDAVAQRLKSAAMPLLASLNEEQKATVRRIAQRMGIGDMVAVSN